jgi:hypothetical protein
VPTAFRFGCLVKDGTQEQHELWVETAGADDREVRVMVGGRKEQDAEKLLAALDKQAKGDKEEARTWISKAEKLIGQMKAAARRLLPLLVKRMAVSAEPCAELQPTVGARARIRNSRRHCRRDDRCQLELPSAARGHVERRSGS